MGNNNSASSLPGGRPDGNKYQIFNPDYVLFAAENWAVSANIQLLNHIVASSPSPAFKAQAKQLLAYFEALGIPDALAFNLAAKSQVMPPKPKGPRTPSLFLFSTLPGKDGGR